MPRCLDAADTADGVGAADAVDAVDATARPRVALARSGRGLLRTSASRRHKWTFPKESAKASQLVQTALKCDY
jgi:hypothetical protein